MNPYSSDHTESSGFPQERGDIKPPGLSAGTIIATILMLLFGFYGLMGILGLVGNAIMLTNGNNSMQTPSQTTDSSAQQAEDASGTDADGKPQIQSETQGGSSKTVAMPPAFQPSFANTISTFALGILDFILAIPMVLWSIQVLQRKRSAAVKLSWLALGMALLTIVRGGLTFLFLPEVMEQVKKGMLAAQQQQSPGGQNPPPVDFDTIMQVMTSVGMGCMGIIFLFNFLVYLFTFFQLRKPTTLERLDN